MKGPEDYEDLKEFQAPGPPGPVPQSAFRAEILGAQPITQSITRVLFPTPIFDLNGEYDPVNSVFVPNQSGVYSIVAGVLPTPDTPTIDQRFTLIISVNGNQIGRVDNYRVVANDLGILFIGTTVSTIYRLNAGDEVEVIAFFSGDTGTTVLA
ncbi:hypothetical protein ABWK46_16160, partial [Peribacillus frigoritolerans]|uniref:hypothetical protein n=1 Tax=Peribacillus frigoritolerans TaxID=450367 RepID=UPI0033963761